MSCKLRKNRNGLFDAIAGAADKVSHFAKSKTYRVSAKDLDRCKRKIFKVRATSPAEAVKRAKSEANEDRYNDFKAVNPMPVKKSSKAKKKNGVRRGGKVLYGAAAKAVLKQRKKNAARKARKNPTAAQKKAWAKLARLAKARAKAARKKTNPKRRAVTVSRPAARKVKASQKRRNAISGSSSQTAQSVSLARPAKKAAKRKSSITSSTRRRSTSRSAFSAARNPIRRRRNYEVGSIYESFTGQAHDSEAQVLAPTGAPMNLDELGEFVEFKWVGRDGERYTVNLEDQGIEAILAAHRYADGRDELVLTSAPGQPLPYFGDYLPHGDHGHICEVTYRAQKAHLGDHSPKLYYHQLGEETGQPPTFHINREGELVFKGGEYWIEDRGIVN